jgi:hypothetical protein
VTLELPMQSSTSAVVVSRSDAHSFVGRVDTNISEVRQREESCAKPEASKLSDLRPL